jgi:hypothetical protein
MVSLPNLEPILPLDEIEARMRPGRFSQKGFLGPNERLKDVLELDSCALTEMGLTTSELARQLMALLVPVVESRVSAARVHQFRIRLQRFKGFQICPFALDPHRNQCQAGWAVHLASVDWRIRNMRTSKELAGPGLIVHLIGAHHFFEGLESPYRLGPRALAELLELGLH